jgi:enoyl-[acyl-carrier-protein] reductase (NADH)
LFLQDTKNLYTTTILNFAVMSFRLSTIQEYSRFVAIDIGSCKIRVLICEIENGSLKLLGKASIRQNRNHMMDGDIANMR